jgi:hypothetical protein
VRCKATTKAGKRCGAFAVHGTQRCCLHTADNAARFGLKGGHRRGIFDKKNLEPVPIPENAADLLRLTTRTLIEVREQLLDTKTANCIFYGTGAALNALQTADLERRILELEKRHNVLENARR